MSQEKHHVPKALLLQKGITRKQHSIFSVRLSCPFKRSRLKAVAASISLSSSASCSLSGAYRQQYDDREAAANAASESKRQRICVQTHNSAKPSSSSPPAFTRPTNQEPVEITLA